MQQLYIHLHEGDASWAYCAETGCLPEQVESGDLTQLRLRDDDLNIVVFVPTVDVLLASVKVPVKGQQKLAQATPYALEEQLIDDVESMHVAIGSQDSEGIVSTAVVSQSRMKTWMERLKTVHIEPDVMIPDVLALPRVNGDWSALQLDGDLICVRSGEQTGFACDTTNLAIMASSHASESHVNPDNVRLTNCAKNDESTITEQFKNIFSVPVSSERCNGDALASLISGYKPDKGINLLQGAFIRHTRWFRGKQRWLPAAVLLFAWFILQFGLNIYQVQKLASIEEDYKNKVVEVFKQSFPEVTRVSDPQKQMAIKLKSLRGTAVTGGDGYLELMAKISQVLAKVPAVDINSMSYKKSAVDLEVSLKDLQMLENFKESILNVPGVTIDVKSTSQRKGKLVSLIQVRSQK